MRNNQPTHENSKETGQLFVEMPGSWYNYEPTEVTLDTQQFDHWLGTVAASEFRPRQHCQLAGSPWGI